MRGATRDYKNGPKNNWRRTFWNDILRRTNGREQSEFIIYLVGSRDLDRVIAVEKGVPTQNLVAVDRSITNIAAARLQRVPAVQADAIDLLWSWPRDHRVCAVLLDFTSGLEFDNVGVFDALQRPPFAAATVMVNFQRGRDEYSNGLRAGLDLTGLIRQQDKGARTFRAATLLWRCSCRSERLVVPRDDWNTVIALAKANQSHSSDFIQPSVVGDTAIWPSGGSLIVDEREIPLLEDAPPDTNRAFQFLVAHINQMAAMSGIEPSRKVVGEFLRALSPKFYSYRSSESLTFDSVVFDSPFSRIESLLRSSNELKEMEERYREKDVCARISAMLAVRTRRST